MMTAKEEYFPRGGAVSANTTDGASRKRKQKFDSQRDSHSEKRKRTSGEKRSRDETSEGVWSRKLTTQLCQSGLLVLACVKEAREDGSLHLELPGGIQAVAEDSVEGRYHPGMLLSCKVVSGSAPAVNKKRLKTGSVDPVKVTLNPEEVNSGLVASSLLSGLNLSCSVRSVEDKGLEINVGLPSVKAFLPYSECPEKELHVGQILLAKILKGVGEEESGGSRGRMIQLTTDPKKLSEVESTEGFHGLSKTQILPGMSFDASVERVNPMGAVVTLRGMDVRGFVANQHLPAKLRNNLEANDELPVILTYAQPNTNMLGLSGLKHLLDIAGIKKRITFDGLKIGDIVENAKVVQMTSQEAVYFRISKDLMGIANRKQLQVQRKTDGEATVASVYPLGSKHTCRIIGYSLIDRLLRVTTSKSVLKQKIVTIQDATPGQLLKSVKVEAVKQSGIYVKIYDNLRGFIPLLHSADVPLRKPEKTLKIGKKLKCRVLYRDEAHNRLVLTAKKWLVDSEFPPVSRYDSSCVDSVTDGVVVNLQDNGALVSLYGKARGWMRKDQLKKAGVMRPKLDLSLGQPVRVRILSVDEEEEKMQLELVSRSGQSGHQLLSSQEMFSVKEARVEEVTLEGAKVTLGEDGISGFLPRNHLTDFSSQEWANSLLALCLKPGEILKVGIFAVSGTSVTVTAKPILLEAFENGWILEKFDDLQPGALVYGVIEKKHPHYGYFIDVPGGLTGLASFGNTEGGSGANLSVGQTVVASVITVDKEKRRFSLTLRPRFCYSSDWSPASLPLTLLKQALSDKEKVRIAAGISSDKKLQALSGLKEGDVLESARIESVSSEGAICDLGVGEGLKGVVIQVNMGLAPLEEGSKVKAAVLSVDYDQKCAELSLSEGLVEKLQRRRTQNHLKVGDTLTGEVMLAKSEWVLVWIESGGKLAYLPARLHPNEPLEFRHGRRIKVIVKEEYGNKEHLVMSEKHDSSLGELEKAKKRNSKSKMVLQQKGKIKLGSLMTCRIVSVNVAELSVEVDFPGGGRGMIHASELADTFDSEGGNPLEDYFESNREKQVTVKCIGFRKRKGREKMVECSLRESKLQLAKAKRKLLAPRDSYSVGEEIPVFISKVEKTKISVSINPLWTGFLTPLHFSRKLAVIKRPKKYFRPSQVYSATVITRHKKEHQLNLSLLPLNKLNVTAGRACMGRVLTNELQEVGFELPNGHSSFAGWVDFSDDFDCAKAVKENLKRGQIVRVYPLRQGECGRGWKVSLRKSLLKKKKKSIIKDPYLDSVDGLRKKEILRGFVKEITKESIEVAIGPEPEMVGKLATAQAEEDCGDFGLSLLHVGSVVTVEIAKIAGSKIDLSLHRPIGSPTRKRRRTNSTLSDGSSASESPVKGDILVSSSGEETVGDKKVKVELDIQEAFDWQPSQFSMENLISVGQVAAENGVPGPWESEEGGEVGSGGRKRKIGSFERDRIAEEILYRKELSLINPDVRSASGPGDFDRLLFGSPNSSEVWLRYMAYFLKDGKLEKARLVAERALQTIHQRESDELFNVWTGLLNLENNFGTAESVEEVFQRARRGNTDELKVYTQMLKIYQNSGKIQSDDVCEEMLRRFRGSHSETWLTVGWHLMSTGRPERARELMQRALKSLHPRDHVGLLSRFAQMEYKSEDGDKERGKTIFENILSSYPKKVDVWSVFIDMTLKYGSMDDARPLFERVTGLQLGSHKMRFFFKKWLELEEKHGSEKFRKSVRDKAVVFVDEAQKRLIG